MTEEQHSKCSKIIHGHAIAAAAGNAVPVPGLGFAADMATMTTMAMALAAVFGSDIPEYVAKSMAIAALKKAALKQPIKTIGKELSKFIPFAGSVIAASVSAGMLEAAGWSLAKDMEARAKGY